jgi:16S rRNA processing protein RimM
LSPETNGDFITLARIVKTQGRRGEVAAEVHTHVPGRFTAGMKLSVLGRSTDPRRELEVEDLWPHQGLLVLKFRDVDSMSQAEALVGCELQLPRSERAPLEQGWNYVSDLVGCSLFDHGSQIGRIEDVQFGAGEAPLLIVAGSTGKRFDIPFAEAYLEAVNLTERQVRMSLPEGMLEVNAPVTAEEKQQRKMKEKEKEKKRRERH